MSEDRFFERLRHDAAPLRYDASPAAMARMAARIRERTAEVPGVAQILARWFRPLTAAVTAVAIAAAIGLAALPNDASAYEAPFEITMGGETYRVE